MRWTTVLLGLTIACSASAQSGASDQPHRLVLPLPKTASSQTTSADSTATTGVSNPPADVVQAPASAPDSEVTPSMEAARAAIAALNRASASTGGNSLQHAQNLTPASYSPRPSPAIDSTSATPEVPRTTRPRRHPLVDASYTPTPSAPNANVETAIAAPAPAAAPATGYTAAPAAAMMRDFDSSEPAEQVMHVAVGHSIFVDTKHRLTRVYVTDPTILNSYTASPNQIVVTALKAGSSTVLVWDESGESQAYLISADMNVIGLQHALTQGFPSDSIQAQGDEDRVVLTGYVGTQAHADAAGKLAAQYTKQVSNSLVVNSSRVKQVRLKVRIVEVDRSKLAQFGFNFFSQGGNNTASTTTGGFPSSLTVATSGTSGGKTATVSNPLNFMFYSSKFNVGATLQDLANMNILQILAEPTITTMSGNKASFLAGGEFPFPEVQAGGTGGAPTVTVSFRPYGVKLDFTPVVNPDGTIDLKVAPEVSALDFANAVSIAGYTIPALSSRKADTQMVLQSGQSFAISGLLDQRTTDTLGRTPGISSIPILGELFKSKNINHSVTELVVLVTPTIVDPLAESIAAENPEPKIVVPMIQPNKFDKELPKAELKQQ